MGRRGHEGEHLAEIVRNKLKSVNDVLLEIFCWPRKYSAIIICNKLLTIVLHSGQVAEQGYQMVIARKSDLEEECIISCLTLLFPNKQINGA